MIAALLMAVVVSGDLPLPDAAKEARAQALMREIRCVVCENEPVSQSTADIAVDMRRVIREQVDSGADDNQVRKFFSDRYGQFVLFRPPTNGLGLMLWIFPFLLLVGAGGVIAARLAGARKKGLSPLPDDQAEAGPE
jgi:cytochrome c-type biogenesis protein CcmH